MQTIFQHVQKLAEQTTPMQLVCKLLARKFWFMVSTYPYPDVCRIRLGRNR